ALPDLYAELDRVIEEVVRAKADRNDREGRFPRESLDALAEIGWTGVLNEPRHGGLGLDHAAFAKAAYRIGQADASTGLVYVMQTRSPGAKDQTDISFFIIDGKSPGIEPGPWDALGVRANHSGPIRYNGVKVPPRDRLGREGQGKEIIYDGVSPVYLIGLGA